MDASGRLSFNLRRPWDWAARRKTERDLWVECFISIGVWVGGDGAESAEDDEDDDADGGGGRTYSGRAGRM